MESTLREYNSPQKRNLGVRQHLPNLLLEVYNVNNRRFTEFFDRYFHIPLPIATKRGHGLPFLHWYTPIHDLFSYRGHRHTQTDRHTHTNQRQ